MPARPIPAIWAGLWKVDETFDIVSAAPDDAENAVRFRRGWFLGDGTGAGKGRQVAGILLDNWLKGRRRAVWVSKSDKLIEDAQRDWSALGQERLLVTPLSAVPPGARRSGWSGASYLRPTPRCAPTGATRRFRACGRSSIGWAPISTASSSSTRAMPCKTPLAIKANAATKPPRSRGRAGLRLQHALPNARIVYVSATGATTVHNLAYAQRLGLWGGEDFPFATRAEFVEAIEAGGVAAMEVLARDLRALGLYAARSLSYEGVEYDLVEHQAHRRADTHLRFLCRRVRHHSQQPRCGAEGDERHRRHRHAERPGQIRRPFRLRERQAAFSSIT